ncbi:MAG: phosphoadenosine phosphosulfate reductase family protein [Bryobacteraceae bacterium]
MKQTLDIINRALAEHSPGYIAFSGGTDSTVLVDLVYTQTAHRPPLLYCDAQNDYPGTLEHVRSVAAHYGAKVHTIRSTTPLIRQWTRRGWPMLGKLAGRQWMQRNPGLGIRLDNSACCDAMKTRPSRRYAAAQGWRCALTGMRGAEDDRLRRMRSLLDGAISYHREARCWTANPLTGWTACMINRYRKAHRLIEHPARAAGAVTIGCIWCGGGAQFDASCYRILRRTNLDLWRRFVVDLRGGEIILSVKHRAHLQTVRVALDRLGGLARVASERPWVFDFLQMPPRRNYDR